MIVITIIIIIMISMSIMIIIRSNNIMMIMIMMMMMIIMIMIIIIISPYRKVDAPVRPTHELRLWISEGSTQTYVWFNQGESLLSNTLLV